MDIQWFPGHMAKTKKLVQENLKLVDVVLELLDARIPMSSRNPLLIQLAAGKPRIIVLNKADLADPRLTHEWEKYFTTQGCAAVAVDSIKGAGIKKIPLLVQQLAGNKTISLGSSGRLPRPPRCMIVGIPNVGKSFFINRLVGRRTARTGNKPGVTRGRQWIRLGGMDLLDTPGILWPKFEDPQVAYHLAVTGAIKEEVYQVEEVALELLHWFVQHCPEVLVKRYGFTEPLSQNPGDILASLGQKRGFFQQGMKVDRKKSAVHLLKEFREGKLGRFTLEIPLNINHP